MRQMKKKETAKQWQDKTAAWIAREIIAAQLSVSDYLQKQERRLTTKQKKKTLFLFCLLGGSYLLYLLGSALYYQPTSHSEYGVTPVQENAQPPPDTFSSDKRAKTFKHQ